MRKTGKVRPRNPLVAPALFRKAGRHEQTFKALRRDENARIKMAVKDGKKGTGSGHDITVLETSGVMSWPDLQTRNHVAHSLSFSWLRMNSEMREDAAQTA